jgi:anti-anti-sigma regulatory factor
MTLKGEVHEMSDAIIDVHLSDDGTQSTVVVGGSVTIENSEDFRLALAEALGKTARVALDIRKLEEVDITAAQVICSACKTAVVLQRSLVMEGNLPECIIALGKDFGATVSLLCRQNRNEQCSWFGGAQ